MSTQRLLPKRCQGMGRSVVFPLSLLAGVLLIWQLVLPSVALAATPIPSPTSLSLQSQEGFDIAGGSVVRLVATYTSTAVTTPGHVPPSTQCTGLGVLVGSWLSSTTTQQQPDFINWVLSDPGLVTPTTTTTSCTSLGSSAGTGPSTPLTLSSLHIASNVAYGGGTAAASVFGLFSVASSSKTCALPACILTTDFHMPSQGGILFAFHTSAPQPFLTVAASETGSVLGIELASSATSSAGSTPWPTSPQLPLAGGQSPSQFLVPAPYQLTGSIAGNEPGMPVVNSSGELTQLRLTHGTLRASDLSRYLTSQPDLAASPIHSNVLQTAWQTGVKDFYTGNYPAALQALQQANGQNTDFQALPAFETKVTTAQTNATGNGGNTANGLVAPSDFFGIPFWVLTIVGLGGLFALFVIVSLNFGRKRAQKRQELAGYKADELEAHRRAEIEVQREAQRQRQALQTPKKDGIPMAPQSQQSSYYAQPSPEPKPTQHGEPPAPSVFQQQQSFPVQQPSPREHELKARPINPVPASDLRCPNCGQAVPATATFCPNCRYPLVPLAQHSGSPLNTQSVPELSMNSQIPKPPIVFQPSQESVTEPIQDDLIVRETLRRLWDREGR